MLRRKLISALLVMTTVFGMLPAAVYSAESTAYTDMPDDWSTAAMENAVMNGLLSGYEGKILPKDNLTREQMAALMNRAFGMDVDYTDNPKGNISREEFFSTLAQVLRLSSDNENALNRFVDKAQVSPLAEKATAALVDAGYVCGSEGRLNPKQYITRAETAKLMDNVIKSYIKEAGTYASDISGTVMVNVPGVIFKNMKIYGDLIIGDGVGDGDVTLDNVTVTGRTLIRGGGVNSIRIMGKSDIQNIVIARVNGQVRVYAEDGLELGEIVVDGSDDVVIEGNTGTVTVVASNVTVNVTGARIASGIIEGDNSKIIVASNSTIQEAEINGKDAEVIVMRGATVDSIAVNGTGASINGEGRIGEVKANAEGITVTTPGTRVTAAPGISGIKAGEISVVPGGTEIVPGGNTGSSGSTGGGGGSRRDRDDEGDDNEPASIAVTAITVISEDSVVSVVYGETLQMSVVIAPANATDKTIIWSVESLDVGTADIDASGLLAATGAGTVRVAASNPASGVIGTKDIEITAGEAVATPEEYFEFDSETGTIIDYHTEGGLDVVIPVEIGGVEVTHIGNEAFLPDINSKGDFENCLTSVVIPDTVESIGDYAFAANLLTEVNISSRLTSMGEDVFVDCMELTSFNVDSDNSSYSSHEGVLYNKEQTTLLRCPYRKAGSYTIPDTVTSIADSAFRDCTEITEVNIPDRVTSIGGAAFYRCVGLTEVNIPDGVSSIGSETFSDCIGLTSVAIPESVTSIGYEAFYNCSELYNITIPNDVEIYGDNTIIDYYKTTEFKAAYGTGGAGTYTRSGDTWTK